ncbi:MAG: cytochrome c biogenesis protein CcsA [Thermotogae bacterium]|nr:cytochrome c biogenesis protein CcsA [Thermotogota bacterium]
MKVGLYEFAEITLRVGILSSALAVLFSLLRRGKLARNLLDVSVVSVFVASGILLYALLTSDMRLVYVQSYTSKALPLFYKFTAWWGGQAGSLLFWAFTLGVYALLALRKDDHPILVGTFAATMFFFLITTTYAANPFERTLDPAPDGRGLNPLLQNVWMAVHPPLLYLGYVGMTVPFAYSLLMAFTGFQKGEVLKTRMWLLLAWAFLGMGILLGGRWAYLELGWGGYWAWDPVENASLIPWLTSTAAIHTFVLVERKGYRLWAFNLVFASFLLSILGTFLTRSGLIESVHAFAFSNIGNYFLVFMAVLGAFWLLSFAYIVHILNEQPKASPNYPIFSRGWYLDLANYLWVILTVIVLGGTFSPLITEIFTGVQITTQPSFFTFATAPFWSLIVLAVALSLLAPWDRPGKLLHVPSLVLALVVGGVAALFGRNWWAALAILITSYPLFLLAGRAWSLGRRSLKDYPLLAHLGLLLGAVGVALSWNYGRSHEMAFKPKEIRNFYAFRLQHLGWQEYDGPNYDAVFSLMGVRLWNWNLGEVRTERRKYRASGEITTEPGILPIFPVGDLYVVMQGAEDDGTFYYDVRFVPGIQLVWIGPTLVFLVTILVVLSLAGRRRRYNKGQL